MTYSQETTVVIDYNKLHSMCKKVCAEHNTTLTKGLLLLADVNLSSINWSKTVFPKIYDVTEYPNIELGAMRIDLFTQLCFGLNLNPSDYIVNPTTTSNINLKHMTKLLCDIDDNQILDLDSVNDVSIPANEYLIEENKLKFYANNKLYTATCISENDTKLTYIFDNPIGYSTKSEIHNTIISLYKNLPIGLKYCMGGNSMRCPSVGEVFRSTEHWEELHILGYNGKLNNISRYFNSDKNRIIPNQNWWCNTPADCNYGIIVTDTGEYKEISDTYTEVASIRPIMVIHKHPEQTINVPHRSDTADNNSENGSENTVIEILEKVKTLSKADVISLTIELVKYIGDYS